MQLSWLLLLTTACAVHGATVPRALWQFAETIQCYQPGINPFVYNNYGCFCGVGGGGSPVDQLDQCCVVHDNCYSNANKIAGCSSYLQVYDFSCSSNRVTCLSSNNSCQAAVCECDRAASSCFAQYHYSYNTAYKDMDRTQC